MAFGIDTGTARNTNNSVQLAEKVGITGIILDMTSHGGKTETTEEYYNSGAFSAETGNGDSGTSVVSAHNLIESNVDYSRESKTTIVALG